jgi:hypothetical protein
VRKGTTVAFAVNVSESGADTRRAERPLDVSLRIFQPQANQSLLCIPGTDGTYRITTSGTSIGITNDYRLLVWVRPVRPPAELLGWYLQRPPNNGIPSVEGDGAWRGTAQIGNAQWPPHDGDIVDIAVSIIDRDTADRLIALPGVVVRAEPVGLKQETVRGLNLRLR